MWGITGALERAGEALTKTATNAARKRSNTTPGTNTDATAAASNTSNTPVTNSDDTPAKSSEETYVNTNSDTSNSIKASLLSQRFQKGWGSVMEATKHAVEATREAVEKEQSRLFSQQQMRRDPSLPLDVEALRDAEVVYITDRLISMSHPALQSPYNGDLTPSRKLTAVAHLLEKRHGDRYMVWNLSEVDYDVSLLHEQVLTFSFPGSPSPPLGLLLKLLISIESWLKADERNVAVVHCLTGRGRTSTVLAAFLCWMGEAGFRDLHDTLDYIAQCKHLEASHLTIPSQRRYASYFANMLDGVRPSQPPLMLQRIIMSQAPRFAKGPPPLRKPAIKDKDNNQDDEENTKSVESLMGCAPYLQIFKAGHLVFTTAATQHHKHAQEDELPFCYESDGPVSFNVQSVVQGDILIRCRHLTASGQRVSMFRAALHTGYVPPKVMRLTKAQLDGACSDGNKRFSDDFYVDVIFETCDAEMASKHLSGKTEAANTNTSEKGGVVDGSKNEAEERRSRGTLSGAAPASAPTDAGASGAATVTASAYDSMLHRDSRFWDVIAARRQEHASKQQATSENPMWGPTVGRRRDLSGESTKQDEKEKDTPQNNPEQPEAKFSIGGEFDFFIPEEEEKSPTATASPPPKQRDELMDALNALDDETESPVLQKKRSEIEEIVFETGDEPKPTLAALPVDVKSESKVEGTNVDKKGDDDNDNETNVEMSEPLQPNSQESAQVKKDNSAVEEAAALLDDTDLLGDTEDVDAFLASVDNDYDENDALPDDIDDLDFDDDELEDLENFLSKAK